MLKKLYFFFGLFFVLLGYIGLILPLVPTTPFLILSLWFFSKSSKKIESWLLNHRIFGPSLSNWKKYKSIQNGTKLYIIIIIILSFSFSIYISKFSTEINLILVSFAALLCLFIVTRSVPPSKS